MSDENHELQLTAGIVAAYVENHAVQIGDLPSLLQSVHQALAALGTEPEEPEPVAKITTAKIRRSITPDALISFEDGRRYKQLKRHLATLGLTPNEYRAKWGLPADYPMVAASYSAQRSALAKAAGLGKKEPLAPAPVEAPKAEPAKVRIKGKLGLFGRRSRG